MDPTLEEKQDEPSQQKRSTEGTISRGINTINNFARRGLTSPFGKVGSRIALQTGLRGLTAFLGSTSGVWVPIAIAIVSVFIFTFIIVGFGGAPVSQTSQSVNLTVTPTPAAP